VNRSLRLSGVGAAAAWAVLGASFLRDAPPSSFAPQPEQRPVRVEARPPVVYRVAIHGTVDLGLSPYVRRVLREAASAGAAAVVLDVNTPGGRIDAAWEIVDAVQDATVPVYAYVDRALSAGAMVALAAQAIYMRPGATIGAATPVEGMTGEEAPEKVVSAMRSEFRALAEARGLDPRIAEAMVDPEVEVEGVVERGKLLTLTAEEALRLGYAKGSPPTFDALLEALGLAGAEVRAPDENWAEAVVRFLTNPIVAPLLLSLGLLGLLVELKTPSFGVAGITGLVLLAAFFGAHLLVGLAGWEEILLLLAGLLLLALEVFVIPGFGVAGVLGLLAVSAAVFLALLGRFPTATDVSRALAILAATLLIFLTVAYSFVRHLPARQWLPGIFLRETEAASLGYVSSAPRPELVGRVGTAATDLRPAGIGLFDDERLDVVSEGQFVPAGTKIKVLRAEGYRLVVRPVEAAPTHDTGASY
jgi:membrane-bound serine protease (ClpP class)